MSPVHWMNFIVYMCYGIYTVYELINDKINLYFNVLAARSSLDMTIDIHKYRKS